MSAFHQMGHHSQNLLLLPELSMYRGAILSPVNSGPSELAELTDELKVLPDFRTVFDPQLYYPRTERGRLRDWAYFPADVDSADLSTLEWWKGLNEALLRPEVLGLAPRAIVG